MQHEPPRLHSAGEYSLSHADDASTGRSSEVSPAWRRGRPQGEGCAGGVTPVTLRPRHSGTAPVVARVARGGWSRGVGIGGQPPGSSGAGLAGWLLAVPAGSGQGAAGGLAARCQTGAHRYFRPVRQRVGAGSGLRAHGDPGRPGGTGPPAGRRSGRRGGRRDRRRAGAGTAGRGRERRTEPGRQGRPRGPERGAGPGRSCRLSPTRPACPSSPMAAPTGSSPRTVRCHGS